jgi:hypothetical protein
MILLVWPSERAPECAQAIEQALQQTVRVASNLEQASAALKMASFSAVLIDQWIYPGSPAQFNLLFQHLGSAAVVTVNFAISATDRVVRSVRAALDQRDRESRAARREASALLLAELKDDVTALLLLCGVTLQEPNLIEAVAGRIRTIEQVANQIRRKLLAEDDRKASIAAHA